MEQKNNYPTFSDADIKRILGSREGQALLQILMRDGGTALKQAANALRAGNSAKAQEIVKPLLSSEDAAKIMEKLTRK